jgi:hypothetical protein
MTQGAGPDGLGQEPANDGQPPGWPPPAGYGQPGGYGAPPPGYGTPPGYGAPPGYGQQSGYGGYGGPYGSGPYSGGPYGGGPYGGGPAGAYGKPWAPKPGIIPLRPLSLGDILGGAFSALKWNPKTLLVPSAVMAVISGGTLAVVAFLLDKGLLAHVSVPVAGQALTSEQVKSFVIPILKFAAIFGVVAVIFSIVTSAVLTGTLTVAVGQGVLGKKEALGSALQAALARIGPLLATVVLPAVFIGLGWVAAVGVSVGLGVVLGEVAHLVAIGVLVGVLGYLAATVFAVIIGIRWSLAIPILMLEHRGPLASLGRSWRLVRGSAWRVLGITLVTGLIIDLIAGAITAPIQIAQFAQFAGATGPLGTTQLQPTIGIGSMLASGVGEIVAVTLTAPLAAAVSVLLYADLRMRKENMAATLQAAAAAQSPGDGTTAAPPSPW